MYRADSESAHKNQRSVEMEGLSAPPKNLVKDSRERVRNRVGAHVEDELAKSTITLGLSSSERENGHMEELGMFLDLQVLVIICLNASFLTAGY